MSKNIYRTILLVLCIVISAASLFCGGVMLLDPTGETLRINGLLFYFQILPYSTVIFQNFFYAGIVLIIANGIPNFIASILLINDKQAGGKFSSFTGILLMLLISIQFIIFPLNTLSSTFFLLGMIQFITGLLLNHSYAYATLRIKF